MPPAEGAGLSAQRPLLAVESRQPCREWTTRRTRSSPPASRARPPAIPVPAHPDDPGAFLEAPAPAGRIGQGQGRLPRLRPGADRQLIALSDDETSMRTRVGVPASRSGCRRECRRAKNKDESDELKVRAANDHGTCTPLSSAGITHGML